MPVWIPEYLRKNKTEASNDQTLYIDLPKREQISFLQIEVSAQGEAAPRTTTTLIDEIEKYEVIADGSKVLYSLEPEIAYYIDFITHGGIYPPMSFNYTPNARETHEFIIPFGRYEFDEEYLLDTGLYDSVQLRIPYDISDTDVHNAGTFRHNVVMWRPLDRLTPRGFIRSRVVKKETSGTAVETIEHKLPTTFPLRYVGCRFEDLDQNIATDCTAIKVNIDEGRLILADLNINEWLDMDKKRWPRKNAYKVVGAWTDSDYLKVHTDAPWPEGIVSNSPQALMYRVYHAIGEKAGLVMWLHDGSTAPATQSLSVFFSGPNPHKCLTLIDGRKEPFDVTRYTEGKIEYELDEYETILHTFVQEVVAGALR